MLLQFSMHVPARGGVEAIFRFDVFDTERELIREISLPQRFDWLLHRQVAGHSRWRWVLLVVFSWAGSLLQPTPTS